MIKHFIRQAYLNIIWDKEWKRRWYFVKIVDQNHKGNAEKMWEKIVFELSYTSSEVREK